MALLFRDFQDRLSAAASLIGRYDLVGQRRFIKRCPASGAYLAPMLAALLAGCSIHPLQQDVTGLKTKDLVNFIRCEARFAIQDKALELMNSDKDDSELARELRAYRLEGRSWPINTRARMNPAERDIYDKYIDTGIAFDFSFDIAEDNAGGGVADPIRLLTNGVTGIGLSAGGNFMRDNLRHFVVSDTARDLLINSDLPCAQDYRAPNYAYPISGRIGLQELISTFFDLNENRALAPADKDKPTTVFVDTLTFTTTITGMVSPHVIVSPIGHSWGLASPASVTGSASRIDKHSLIVGLSLDKPKPKLVTAAAIVPSLAGKSALQRSGVSQTEQSALDAVNQARIDAYLDRATR